MGWSDFSISSKGPAATGVAKIVGTQTENGIASLQIEAFGKKVQLNGLQLKSLEGMNINGMQLTFEKKDGDGIRLFIVISRGFSSGLVKSKLIEMDEKGNIAVSEP
ncbi:hypothetical protein GCM10027277_49820 [Pseudoduganella ginsengisoli]